MIEKVKETNKIVSTTDMNTAVRQTMKAIENLENRQRLLELKMMNLQAAFEALKDKVEGRY